MLKPPFKVEYWDARGNSRIINYVVSLEAARRVYEETAPRLDVGECVRVRDARGATVCSSDPNEWTRPSTANSLR